MGLEDDPFLFWKWGPFLGGHSLVFRWRNLDRSISVNVYIHLRKLGIQTIWCLESMFFFFPFWRGWGSSFLSTTFSGSSSTCFYPNGVSPGCWVSSVVGFFLLFGSAQVPTCHYNAWWPVASWHQQRGLFAFQRWWGFFRNELGESEMGP